jgi:valyl-tRNA synthetase
MSRALEDYRFNDAANICYQFVWHELCDWYLEMAKQNLYGEESELKSSSKANILDALIASLKLLHPFMPFVTEEIWEKLPGTSGSIMESDFPETSDYLYDEIALKEMDLLTGVITGVRNIRGEMNIPPSRKVSIVIDMSVKEEAVILERNIEQICALAKVERVDIEMGSAKPEASATAVFASGQVHVLLKGLLDFEEEKSRLRKEIKKLENDIAASNKKLNNKGFLEKAPREIVEEVRSKVDILSAKLEKINQNLSLFETIND